MMDLTSADKVFKASAFEPTDEDLADHKRDEKAKRNAKNKPKPPPSKYDVPDILSDSDSDDLPEVNDIFNYRKKAKVEPESDDDVSSFFLCCWVRSLYSNLMTLLSLLWAMLRKERPKRKRKALTEELLKIAIQILILK